MSGEKFYVPELGYTLQIHGNGASLIPFYPLPHAYYPNTLVYPAAMHLQSLPIHLFDNGVKELTLVLDDDEIAVKKKINAAFAGGPLYISAASDCYADLTCNSFFLKLTTDLTDKAGI